MRIILLRGKSNSGKSTTINFVYDELVQKRNAQIINKRKKTQYGSANDFEAVISYKNKKIAIFSFGDTRKWCKDAIYCYSKNDILIMAYNSELENFPICDDYEFLQIVSKNVAVATNQAQQAQAEIQANYKDCATICSLI